LAVFNNTKFYQDAIIKYGISAQGVHWRSRQTQEKRFEILIKFIKDQISTSTILDVGCGFGDLIKYFSSNELYPKSYLGIDKEDFFIEIATMIYPNTNFKQIDIFKDKLPNSDFYICSGALNIYEFDEMKEFIRKCLESSNKGFVFNFLVNTTFNGVEKEEILEYCKTLNCTIEIKEKYLENDFSVFLKK
jgi:SAM-dependent methyltransferase